MYYKINNNIVEVYYDELFHDCRRGAWTIRDVATKKQFYFNGFSVTMASDISEERLIDLLDYGVVQNPKEFQKVTIEDVERYKCMKELID